MAHKVSTYHPKRVDVIPKEVKPQKPSASRRKRARDAALQTAAQTIQPTPQQTHFQIVPTNRRWLSLFFVITFLLDNYVTAPNRLVISNNKSCPVEDNSSAFKYSLAALFVSCMIAGRIIYYSCRNNK